MSESIIHSMANFIRDHLFEPASHTAMKAAGSPIRMFTTFGLAIWVALVWAFSVRDARGISELRAQSPVPNAVSAGISLRPFAGGFQRPVDIAAPDTPYGPKLYIAEQGGLIRAVDSDGNPLPTPFLDIRNGVDSNGERGLLAMTFDPDYASNGYLYLFYSRAADGATIISRFTATGNGLFANPLSELIILTVGQPYANHNGGDLNFGPDGYLYISLGDGGSAGDPEDRAQALGTLLGKIVRIDLDPAAGLPPDCGGVHGNYSIPAGNPWQDGPGGACDELWAYGLRNPWRFSFDAETGDMFIADVGQGKWEEVNVLPAGGPVGANFGWRCFEGPAGYNASGCSSVLADYLFPQFSYPHGAPDYHCSVTGGETYRGGRFPLLRGHHLFADFCSGTIWSLMSNGMGSWQTSHHGSLISRPSSFGVARDGELYVASHNSGEIFHLVENTPGPRLELAKSGPTIAWSTAPITYTLTVTNSGPITATIPLISDTLPAGATYLGSSHSGQLVGSTVRWSLPSLGSGDGFSVQLVVSATKTLRNERFIVTAQGGYWSMGAEPVITIVDPLFVYLPLAQEP